jgi:hypothetical protein
MEVNAATSRIMSVIWLSFTRYVFILFRYCSVVNRIVFCLVNAEQETNMRRFIFAAALLSAHAAFGADFDPARIVDAAIGDWNGDGKPDLALLAEAADDADDDQLGIYIYLRDDHDLLRLATSAPGKIWGTTVPEGIYGQEPSVKAAGKSSIAIHTQNSAIGRDRWEQILTLAYRNNQFVIAGYTYSHYDTLDPDGGGTCDYNALTGKLQKDGKDVKAEPRTIAIADWKDETGQSICGN